MTQDNYVIRIVIEIKEQLICVFSVINTTTMYEPSEKPKFERGNSIHSLRRTLSQMSSKSSVEDPDASPEFKVGLI